MTLTQATKTCFSKFKDFSGRAPRSEFWKFILFQFFVALALIVVNSVLFGPTESATVKVSVGSDGIPVQSVQHFTRYNSGWLGTLFGLAVLLPTLSAMWRRIHDIGRPGWHILIPLPVGLLVGYLIMTLSLVTTPIDQSTIPAGLNVPETVQIPGNVWLFFAGWLFAMASFVLTTVWLAKKSQSGPNKYGPNPHEVTQ